MTINLSVGEGNGLCLDGGVQLVGNPIVLSSAGASLKLDGEARLQGGNVHLASGKAGASVVSTGSTDERGIATFHFTGIDPKTANEVCVTLSGPRGQVIERTLDASCVLRLEGQPGDRFIVTDVRRGETSLVASSPEEKTQ